MQHSFDAYLLDILRAGNKIVEFTEGLDFGGYDSASLIQAGVERKFEIIWRSPLTL